MENLSYLIDGFISVGSGYNILYCTIGVVFGMLVGVLPGLGPTAGTAILLPLTFAMTPTESIIMLAGIYYGAMYGGSAVAGTGHFFWVVRIDKLMDEKLFEARAEAWFDTLKASPKRPGVDEILIPGEIENRLFEKAGDAVEIPKSVIEDIKRALCEGGCSEC